MLRHIKDQLPLVAGDGPFGLVMADEGACSADSVLLILPSCIGTGSQVCACIWRLWNADWKRSLIRHYQFLVMHCNTDIKIYSVAARERNFYVSTVKNLCGKL